MPKKARRNVFRQVVVTETHVAFGVVDGSTGNAHAYHVDWDELEEFVRKHGKKSPAGQLPRAVSGYVRDIMETEE